MKLLRKGQLIDFDRKALATTALRSACDLRANLGLDDGEPVSSFDVCEALGVTLRFTDINMEGMYKKGPPSKIFVSSLRPLPRRMFNCAHELAHHVFEHGSTIDELTERGNQKSWEDPDEFLADSFAGQLLMPEIGLRGAINRRGWNIAKITPAQMFVISCEFGVGYMTLLTHMHFGTRELSGRVFNRLAKFNPKQIRTMMLGEVTDKPLVVSGPLSSARFLDVELETYVLLPKDTVYDTNYLELIRAHKNALILEPIKIGKTRVASRNWSKEIRVSKKQYIGLSKYRYLEEL